MRLRLVVGILAGVAVLEFFGDLPGEAYLLALALGAMLMQPNPTVLDVDVPPGIAMAEDDE